MLYDRFETIVATRPVSPDDGDQIGQSREGRPVRAYRFGTGDRRVSLLAGCHADEPVGPRLLRHVCGYLASLPPEDVALRGYEWWIVPHINPDGETRNRAWYRDGDTAFEIDRYLAHVIRELPGDDIEFGFPRDAADRGALGFIIPKTSRETARASLVCRHQRSAW